MNSLTPSNIRENVRPRTLLLWINYLLITLVIVFGTLSTSELISSLAKVYCLRY